MLLGKAKTSVTPTKVARSWLKSSRRNHKEFFPIGVSNYVWSWILASRFLTCICFVDQLLRRVGIWQVVYFGHLELCKPKEWFQVLFALSLLCQMSINPLIKYIILFPNIYRASIFMLGVVLAHVLSIICGIKCEVEEQSPADLAGLPWVICF